MYTWSEISTHVLNAVPVNLQVTKIYELSPLSSSILEPLVVLLVIDDNDEEEYFLHSHKQHISRTYEFNKTLNYGVYWRIVLTNRTTGALV